MKEFTYGIGASWELAFAKRPLRIGGKTVRRERLVRYTVESCRLSRRTEYYTVRMREEEDGSETREELSAARLHYLLNFNLRQKFTDGQREPLPLTADEVIPYYEALRAEKLREYKRARFMIETNKQYAALEAEKKSLYCRTGKAEAFGDATQAAELMEKVHRLDAQQRLILDKLGIDIDVLRMKYDCTICRDRGVLQDGITVCDCARDPARERAIHAFVAAETEE